MTASVFVWAHHAAGGALFDLTRRAEVLGTAAMLPSMQMYGLWSYGHNRVHHGFTSLSTVDWIWRSWTPGECHVRLGSYTASNAPCPGVVFTTCCGSGGQAWFVSTVTRTSATGITSGSRS